VFATQPQSDPTPPPKRNAAAPKRKPPTQPAEKVEPEHSSSETKEDGVDCSDPKSVLGCLASWGMGCFAVIATAVHFAAPWIDSTIRNGGKIGPLNFDERTHKEHTNFDMDRVKNWKVVSIAYTRGPKQEGLPSWFAWWRNWTKRVLPDGARHHHGLAVIQNPENPAETTMLDLNHTRGPLEINAHPARYWKGATGTVPIPAKDQVKFGDFYKTMKDNYTKPNKEGMWSPTYNCQIFTNKTIKEAANAPKSPFEVATGKNFDAVTAETPWVLAIRWGLGIFALWSVFKLLRWIYRKFTKEKGPLLG